MLRGATKYAVLNSRPPAAAAGLPLPVNTAAPVLSPTSGIELGALLSVTTGTWSNSPSTYRYQWRRGGVDIGGATASTYTVVAADHGTAITCAVWATNVTGESATPTVSNGSGTLALLPVNSVAPAISSSTGLTEVGAVLTATTGTWSNSPSSYAYQWKRGATNVGTNANTYTLVTADAAASMTCVVTATNAAGAGSPATSNALSPVLTARKIPTDIAGCIAWYDPNEPGGVVTAAGTISQVTDLSGNGRHMLPAAAGVEPIYNATGINGRVAAEFVGTTALIAQNYTALTGANGYSCAGVIVMSSAATVANSRVFSWATQSLADSNGGGLRSSRSGVSGDVTCAAGTGSTSNIFGLSLDAPHLIFIQRNVAGTVALNADGGTPVTGTPQNVSSGYQRHLQGATASASGGIGTNYWTGMFGPSAYYNALLNSTDRQTLEGILAWRAGMQATLAGGHPYLSAPPRVP